MFKMLLICLAGIIINMIMLHLFPDFIDIATFKADRWYAGAFGTARIIYLILIVALISLCIKLVDVGKDILTKEKSGLLAK